MMEAGNSAYMQNDSNVHCTVMCGETLFGLLYCSSLTTPQDIT